MTCPICKKRMLTGFIPILAVVWVPQYGKIKNVFAYNKVKDKKNGFRIPIMLYMITYMLKKHLL